MSNDSIDDATSPPLDLVTIGMLRSIERRSGGNNLLQDLAGLFDCDDLVRDLRAADRTGDEARLGELAHQLKGRSGTIGAKRLAALCLELESLVRDGDLTERASHVDQISTEFARVAESLKALVPEPTPEEADD